MSNEGDAKSSKIRVPRRSVHSAGLTRSCLLTKTFPSRSSNSKVLFTYAFSTKLYDCYKVFRRDVIQGIQIQENRFGLEPEIVAKVAQQRVRVFEIGISYAGRTYEEGEKI